MTILFLSYWAADDGLSRATVIPHLRILADIRGIKSVVFCSIERGEGQVNCVNLGERVVHIPLYSGTTYLHKISDFLFLPKKLGRIIKDYAIDLCICRGTPAGSLGYLVHRRRAVPYVVESFEPHAQYMADSGVWNRNGLKYYFQQKWERRQLSTARCLITVSGNYRNDLVEKGTDPRRIATVPCAVDADQFAFRQMSRVRLRKQLGFDDECLVGIYVGKFGGLYYDDESFKIFAQAGKSIPNFRLVILTPDNAQTVKRKLAREDIRSSHHYVTYTSHDCVPDFLSAADFAFAPCKPSPSSKFCSPVKVGEYWASGLPVLLTRGVGDDADIIECEGGGFTYNLDDESSLLTAFENLRVLLQESNRHELYERISKLAHKYRTFDQVRTIYERILLAS